MNKIIPITAINQIMRHWRIIFFVWALILTITTTMGINTFLVSPLHPLYTLFAFTLPSIFFLCLSLIFSFSFFSELILSVSHFFLKKKSTSFNHGLSLSVNPKDLVQVISHFSWSIILIVTLVVMFFKFSFQSYQFQLGTTLFTHNELFSMLIKSLTILPDLILSLPIDNKLITDTLEQSLTDHERALWAKWILSCIFIYGLLPRLICLLYFSLKLKRSSKTEVDEPFIQSKLIDKASKRPTLTRTPKSIFKGTHRYHIAIDVPKNHELPNECAILNDMNAFQSFESKLKAEPAEYLTLYIDGNQMPDRGILRRILRLLNLSEGTTMILSFDQEKSDAETEWDRLLSPLLDKNEIIQVRYTC